jgi:hypothetical protein
MNIKKGLLRCWIGFTGAVAYLTAAFPMAVSEEFRKASSIREYDKFSVVLIPVLRVTLAVTLTTSIVTLVNCGCGPLWFDIGGEAPSIKRAAGTASRADRFDTIRRLPISVAVPDYDVGDVAQLDAEFPG